MGWIGPPGGMSQAPAGGAAVDGREDTPSIAALSRRARAGVAVSGAQGPAGMLERPRLPEDRATVDDLNRLVSQSIGAIAIVLGFTVIVLLGTVIVLARRISRLDARLATLTRGGDGGSLGSAVGGQAASVGDLTRRSDELATRMATLEDLQRRAVQRVGLVRFNPFEDTGGNQSFALALLDEAGDGVIVSSLHSRTGTRLYAKTVAGGTSEAALSDEEAEAVRVAGTPPYPRRPADRMRPVTPELARARSILGPWPPRVALRTRQPPVVIPTCRR